MRIVELKDWPAGVPYGMEFRCYGYPESGVYMSADGRFAIVSKEAGIVTYGVHPQLASDFMTTSQPNVGANVWVDTHTFLKDLAIAQQPSLALELLKC